MIRIVRNAIRILAILLLALSSMVWMSSPALAIANPDNIDFGTGEDTYYKVFHNVLESGDWLIAAEGWVDYTIGGIPTDYTASQAFLFEMLDPTGTTTYASTPLQQYGDRPISIYLTAAQVIALALNETDAYQLRITGNPAIFPSQVGNTVTVALTPRDHVDQLLGVDNGVPTANPLRNGMISVANNMETYDAPLPANSYLATVQGYQYLSLAGGDLFQEGITGLSTMMCPILFQAGLEPMTSDALESTGAYALTLTPAQKWGNTVANGLTNLGSYLGINQALAGSVMLFVLVVAFALFVYSKTESGIVVLLMCSATPFLGAYLGLMPMALAFIFVIIIITLLGYFFFSRGAL